MDLEQYEMKLARPAIGPTLGCLIYFGTLAIVTALVAVGLWGLVRSLFAV